MNQKAENDSQKDEGSRADADLPLDAHAPSAKGNDRKAFGHPGLGASLDHVDFPAPRLEKMLRGNRRPPPLFAKNADGCLLGKR